MKVNYRHVLKVISLPLALFLLLPFADPCYWQDIFSREMMTSSEFFCLYWSKHAVFTLRYLWIYVIPDIIEIILLVLWAVKPYRKTGVRLTIGTYFILGTAQGYPIYILIIAFIDSQRHAPV